MLLSITAFGQKTTPAKTQQPQKHPTYQQYMMHKVFDGTTLVDSTKATPQQLVGIRQQQRIKKLGAEHFYFNTMGNQNLGVRFNDGKKGNIYEGLEQNAHQHFYTSVIIADTGDVEMVSQLVTPQNAKNYLFRVIQNNKKEIVKWQTPSTFKRSADGSFTYAYLGRFKYKPQQFLTVELYNTNNFDEQDGMLIDWRKVESPRITASIQYDSPAFPSLDNERVLFSHDFDEIKRVTDKHVFYINRKIVFKDVPFNDLIETTKPGDTRFRLSDTIQNLNFQ